MTMMCLPPIQSISDGNIMISIAIIPERSISDMGLFCASGGRSNSRSCRRRCSGLHNKSSSSSPGMRSRPTTLPFIVIAICLLTRGNALSLPSPVSSKRPNNSISCSSFHRCIYPRRAKYQRNIFQLRSSSTPSNNENLRDPTQRHQADSSSAATPFNHDIARTIFAPLFFSLYHYKNKEPTTNFRHQLTRPSPFEDPSCAQTAERMLRRMMENRYRSAGRTVCPDSRTFGLVAGAYGRLRWGQKCDGRTSGRKDGHNNMVTFEEEANIISRYQNITSDDDLRYGKIQVTPVGKLQELLQLQLRLCHREGWSAEIRPSVDMYNRMFKRLARQSGMLKYQENNRSAEQALLWLQLMRSPILQYRGSDGESELLCHPDAITYAYIIDALSAHRDLASSGAEQLNQKRASESVSTYESMHAFAKQIDVQMIETETRHSALSSEMFLVQAEALLSLLEHEYNKQHLENGLKKDKVERALAHAYSYLAEGWGRQAVLGMSTDHGSFTKQIFDAERSDDEIIMHNREHSIQRSHELLCRLEALSHSIPSSCYSSVILALSTSHSPTAATLAEDVLKRMIARYVGDAPSRFFNVNDVAKAFSGCIAAFARDNDAPKAEIVLNQMIDLYNDGSLGSDFIPEVRAFGTCIALWGKFDGEIHDSSQETLKKRRKKVLPPYEQRLHNADRAEAILSQLECFADNEATKGNEKFVVDATPYNIVILARVQTIDDKKDRYNSDEKEGNERVILHAQSMLDHMEYERRVMPDPYTYSILLHAWCQQSRPGNEKAADLAEELLRRRIEDVDITKIIADRGMTAKTSREQNLVGDIWPNVKHYSSVLKAHAKTKTPGGAKKALALLCEMERRYYDADLVEGSECIGNSIEFHVDQKDVAKPDLVCYSIVIDAFANSRLPEASAVALRLLRAVETKCDAGDESIKPNTRIYTAAILSLVHSPFSADEENHDDGAFAGKRISNNAQRAWSILEKMKANHVPPNSFTYNYIINVAAESAEDHRSSFEMAVRAFQEIRTRKTTQNTDMKDGMDPCHPDSFTFTFMIKACNNLLPPGSLRTEVISQVFRECCRSGYLNDAILDRAWRGLSPEKFYLLVEKNSLTTPPKVGNKNVPSKPPITTAALPSSWSRCCQAIKARNPKGGATTRKKGVQLA